MKKNIVSFIILILVAIYLYPIIWLYTVAFKTRNDIFSIPPKVFFSPTIKNFNEAFFEKGFINSLWNSIFISIISTFISVIISILSAYVFSRLRLKVIKKIYFFVFSLLILPPIVTILPLFLILSKLSLTGNIWTLIFVYVAILSPFGSILLKSFFDKISYRYEEVSMLEKIPFYFFFFNVFIKEAKGPILISSLFMFLMVWNEFLYGMILSSTLSTTLPVSTLGLITPIGTFWGQIAAIGVVCTFPVILFTYFARKQMTAGFTYGIITNE